MLKRKICTSHKLCENVLNTGGVFLAPTCTEFLAGYTQQATLIRTSAKTIWMYSFGAAP